ncbi:hypothetical protein L7F22_044882 [Adiantum nelumboides]|nr:hypothetical protein [Adiantum nelumboides]
MEDLAPRRRRAQRSPTPTKRKKSPHIPHRRESKREEKSSRKKRERKRSPSSPSSSPSFSFDKGSGYSSQEKQRRRHQRSYAAWKRSSKLKKFKEGGKNISFLTYDGIFGATDKVLAFIQQFDAAFGDEGFTESSKLRHIALHFQKCARQCQAIGCKMKSSARGLPRHKTGMDTMSELELQDQTPPTNELVTRSSPSKVAVKVKAMPGTLKCFASNSKQSTKSLKALEYPRLSKFFFLVKELHEEYRLSLEGKLPKELSNKDIPNEEWLSVFKCLHEKSTSYFYHVRDEFVDENRLLYQKVYQAIPSNGELLAKFSQGFVYERCPAIACDPTGHRIAWATFGGSVLENCKMQKGGLKRKINKFCTNYGLIGVIQIEASICDGALSSISTMLASKLQPFQAVETPMYIQQVLSMADRLSGQENEQKRLMGEELDQLNKELEVLKTSPDSDPREVNRKEVEVTGITKMLSKAGATTDLGRLKENLDSLQVSLLLKVPLEVLGDKFKLLNR